MDAGANAATRCRVAVTTFGYITADPGNGGNIGEGMIAKFRRELDPLDLEIVESALDNARGAIKEAGGQHELDSDEELEAALRRELLEIAGFSGVSDPEALQDVLVADLLNLLNRLGMANALPSAADNPPAVTSAR